MKLGQLTYIFSIFLFSGTFVLAKWHKDKKILKKYELVILLVILFFLPFTAFDYFALKWGAWFYNPQRTLDIKLSAEIETYLFAVGVTCSMAIVAIASAVRVDRSLKVKKKQIRMKPKLKLRRAFGDSGATRR